MVAKIIVAIILLIFFITVLYEAIGAIQKKDLAWAVICLMSNSLIGLILGVILGSLLF